MGFWLPFFYLLCWEKMRLFDQQFFSRIIKIQGPQFVNQIVGFSSYWPRAKYFIVTFILLLHKMTRRDTATSRVGEQYLILDYSSEDRSG